jgi:hypothetical protein
MLEARLPRLGESGHFSNNAIDMLRRVGSSWQKKGNLAQYRPTWYMKQNCSYLDALG